ncbi:hypothetical protein Tco_1334695 [Tanacetum coccineum]
MVNLDADDKDDVEEQTRANTRYTRDEEILLTETWVEDYRRKCEAAEAAYEAKRKKELGFLECRELEFPMIDPDSLPPDKVAYIRRKQQETMKKNIQTLNLSFRVLEAEGFCFWKTHFETYVKSKDIDLWQVIQNCDFVFMMDDRETKMEVETPYELLKDDQKKQLNKNNEAKMTLYNALPRKEYERVFMCKTAKEVWHTLIINHQGNSQVKDCKIDLLS